MIEFIIFWSNDDSMHTLKKWPQNPVCYNIDLVNSGSMEEEGDNGGSNFSPPHQESKKNVSNYNTDECVFNIYKSDFYSQSANSTRIVWFFRQSMITTHTSVFWHLRVWFIDAECNFYTQNAISTRTSVISPRKRLVSTPRVQFPHAECDFTRRVCFIHTRE
jgi:hypothetical protein